MLCRDASAQEPVSGTDDRGPYIRLHWTSADDRNGEAFTETRIVGTPLSHYPRRFEHHIRYTLSGRTIDLGPLLVPEVVVDQIDVLVADIPDEIQALEILAYRVTERIAMQATPF